MLVLFIFAKIQKGKYQNQAFWMMAVLTSIRGTFGVNANGAD
jgi:uncharacterized membrane-anchored protein